jgi:DNA-binding XRE family transcriptional regulator
LLLARLVRQPRANVAPERLSEPLLVLRVGPKEPVTDTLPITQQREVITALMEVTLLPSNTVDPETARQMRRELGARIRELRREYGLLGMTARNLAEQAGWPRHKIENAEVGKQTPNADEVRLICRLLDAESETDKLIALIPARRLPTAERVKISWKHDL